MTDTHIHDWQPMSSGRIHYVVNKVHYSGLTRIKDSTDFITEVIDDRRDYLMCSVCGAEIDQLPCDPIMEETEIPF